MVEPLNAAAPNTPEERGPAGTMATVPVAARLVDLLEQGVEVTFAQGANEALVAVKAVEHLADGRTQWAIDHMPVGQLLEGGDAGNQYLGYIIDRLLRRIVNADDLSEHDPAAAE